MAEQNIKMGWSGVGGGLALVEEVRRCAGVQVCRCVGSDAGLEGLEGEDDVLFTCGVVLE